MKSTLITFVCVAVTVSAFAGKPTPTPAPTPVTVGVDGNEPLLAAAPDGTLYISALQHIYSSTDSGATWTELLEPIYASTINLNSDSSISVDPGNRLYFTFDYPYAGTTAVCTSDDRGVTWNCNPAVVPGGTDRMWTLAPTLTDDYEVTNEGLYETAFLHSTDRGSTWTPTSLGAGLLEPQTGPLLQKPGSSNVLQIIKIFGTLPQEVPELKLYVYSPNSALSLRLFAPLVCRFRLLCRALRLAKMANFGSQRSKPTEPADSRWCWHIPQMKASLGASWRQFLERQAARPFSVGSRLEVRVMSE